MSDAGQSGGGGGEMAIQPHGWLILCDPKAAGILGHSANLSTLFPAWSESFAGAKLRDVVGPENAHDLRNALARISGSKRPALLPGRRLPGSADCCDLAVHAASDAVIVEIEKAGPADEGSPLDRARTMIDRLALARDIDRLLLSAARLSSGLLEFDRALVIRFGAGGSAEVVAEQKSPDLLAWANGGCPDGILPSKSPDWRSADFRFIADAAAAPVPLLVPPDFGAVDLAMTQLRAAGPTEREALRRAASASALSLAIVGDDQIWGLLYCLNRTPKYPSMELRATMDVFVRFLSLQLHIRLQRPGNSSTLRAKG